MQQPANETTYLDFNATTPCDPRVVAAMLPFFTERFANPSSRTHDPGRQAFAALESARREVASTLGAGAPSEVIFTSGATEADNLAIAGVAEATSGRRRGLVTQATEHEAVLRMMTALAKRGWDVTVVGVNPDGAIDLDELTAAISPDTALVSLMLANNETGAMQPVAEAADLAHAHGAVLHCDAAQAIGKVPVELQSLGADLVSISGHKIYGPKGVGALWVRRRRPPLRIEPLLRGGGQEHGLRAGTLNLPGVVGLARACTLAGEALASGEPARLAALRDRLEKGILAALDGVAVNAGSVARLPNTCNLAFSGVDGHALMASLSDLAVSSGSACTSARPEPSHVLLAMGLPKRLAAASLRFSLGRPTRREDIERAIQRVAEEVTRLRAGAGKPYSG